MKNTEIERKWLIDGFPPLPEQSRALVEQGYLAFSPNTVRVRRLAPAGGEAAYILTFKGKGLMKRAEVEMPLAAETYEALLPLLATPLVRKDYRTYALPGGHTLECSHVDEGEPTAFYYAEVEFDTEEEALAFTPPPFLGEEKTNDPAFSMAAYCRRRQDSH